MSFAEFEFDSRIHSGITACGFTEPTQVQQQATAPGLEGRDVMGLAQTGTGKTAAFVLPILQHLLQGRRGRVRSLILSPTRELAEQTYQSFRDLGRKTGLKAVTVYGGVSKSGQINKLRS